MTQKNNSRVLIADDEAIIRDTLAEFLSGNGFEVKTAANGIEAVNLAKNERFDVLLCDVNMPGLDGIDVLEKMNQLSPETFVILITAYATVESAIEAFQKGAHDYLMKPMILNEVLEKIRRVLKQRDIAQENQWLRRQLHQATNAGEIVAGQSSAMKQALELVKKVGPLPSTVLILGESGTGKELFAKAIHQASVKNNKSSQGLFLAVNCAAIPENLLENQLFGHRKGAFTGADKDREGMFVHAGNGSVFLDEIGEAPLPIQAKLLRAIEQKEVIPVGANQPIKVEARIIAATNKDLKKEVELGRFRDDLFYRLNVVTIKLPSLRERQEDIPELVSSIITKHNQMMGKTISGCSHEAMQLLTRYTWKGNVRELDNVIQRAMIFADGSLIQTQDLPTELTSQNSSTMQSIFIDDLNDAVKQFERLHIEKILRQTDDRKKAAERLGIGLSSLYRKIEQLGIDRIS